jgi:hypothetical protein
MVQIRNSTSDLRLREQKEIIYYYIIIAQGSDQHGSD